MGGIAKFFSGLLVIVVLVLVGGVVYFNSTFPQVDPAPAITVKSTEESIERGKYLSNHVAVCIDCHSQRDWRYFGGPLKPETVGAGGEEFTRKMGFPGDFYAPNITPTGIGDWTDGEVLRAFTTGVTREDEVIFPVMPYLSYGKMSVRDSHAILSYLRTLEPKESDIPPKQLALPLKMIFKMIPREAEPLPHPSPGDGIAYGRYVTLIAACADCHTPVNEKQQPLEGMYMAGGREFPMPSGMLRTPNLTPHDGSGLGGWTREAFIKRFKAYTEPGMDRIEVKPGGMMTIMPWQMYAGMTEEDLGSIYDYLQTIPAVDNTVQRWSPR